MYLLFDMGGTHMRLAVSKDGKVISEPKIISTPVSNFEEGMRIFWEVAEQLTGGEKIEAVAGGVAGTLDKEHSVLLRAPNIPGWVGKPLKKRLEEVFHAPVHLENDAALAGVGGVRIVDGKIDRNAWGFEIGHQIINYDGETRTLEEYVSGSGFIRRFGKTPQEVKDSVIWEEAARLLAVGRHNTLLHWSPEVVVLGGPMILQSPFSFEIFKQYFEKSVLEVFSSTPEVKKGELGDKGGLYGALAFLYLKHKT